MDFKNLSADVPVFRDADGKTYHPMTELQKHQLKATLKVAGVAGVLFLLLMLFR